MLCLRHVVAFSVLRLVAVMVLVIAVRTSLDVRDIMTRDGRMPPTTFAPVATWYWYADVNGLMICRLRLKVEIEEKQNGETFRTKTTQLNKLKRRIQNQTNIT